MKMFFKRLCAYLVKSWIKEIKGLENIPLDKPFIAAADHIGFADPFLIGVVLFLHTRRKLYFYTKPSIWKVWKRFSKPLGILQAGYRGVRISSKFFKSGHPVLLVIFPEAKINLGKNLFRAKSGVAKLASAYRIPIIPIGYTGPSSKKVFATIKELIHWWRKVKLNIGRPIYLPEECLGRRLSREEAQRISDELMIKISELCGKPYPY